MGRLSFGSGEGGEVDGGTGGGWGVGVHGVDWRFIYCFFFLLFSYFYLGGGGRGGYHYLLGGGLWAGIYFVISSQLRAYRVADTGGCEKNGFKNE